MLYILAIFFKGFFFFANFATCGNTVCMLSSFLLASYTF